MTFGNFHNILCFSRNPAKLSSVLPSLADLGRVWQSPEDSCTTLANPAGIGGGGGLESLRSLLSPCNSCWAWLSSAELWWISEVGWQYKIGRRARTELGRTEASPEGWILPWLRMDQDWTRTRGIYCKYVIVTWEYSCDLACEFKHHTNVTMCDILPFFHQPPQPPHGVQHPQ